MNRHPDFFIPDGIYLLNHSVGLLPKKSRKEANSFLDLWANKGANAWEEWLLVINDFCQALSSLLNSNSQAFCPQINVSSALAKIFYSLPKRKFRKTILLSELDFPSMGYVLQQAQRFGYKLKFLKYAPESSLDEWKKYLKSDVQVAFISHVFSENSYLSPVKEIIEIAREKDIYTIIDVAQSAGVIPINVEEWSADFVIGCSIKWLCGGPGAAFLWVNLAKIDNFKPMDVGWFSTQSPFDFDIYNFQYSKTALRFLGGTPSLLPFYIAKSSINTINTIGTENIYRHNQKLIECLISFAEEKGLTISSSIQEIRRGGTFVLKLNKQKKAMSLLNHHKIMVDDRRSGIRFSPHIYNTEEDIHHVISVLSEI